MTLLAMAALAAFGGLRGTAAEPLPAYAWSLRSGLFTVEADDTLRVLLTEVARSDEGVAATVRFLDGHSQPLGESTRTVTAGEPALFEFHNGGQAAALVRLEIDLSSGDDGVVPVTTVELHGPASMKAPERIMCAGPAISQPFEYACPEGDCPPPPPPQVEFSCPGFGLFPFFASP